MHDGRDTEDLITDANSLLLAAIGEADRDVLARMVTDARARSRYLMGADEGRVKIFSRLADCCELEIKGREAYDRGEGL
jgi:hypothetical protein